MGVEGSGALRQSRKRTGIGIGVALLAVFVVAGITFTNSIGASKVAANAASLHWANAASGTSALTRAALAQALTFTQLHARNQASREDLAFAMEQVENSLAEVADLESKGDHSPSLLYLTRFREVAGEARDALGSSDVRAAALGMDDLEVVYVRLRDALLAEQDSIQEAIISNTEMGQRLNSFIVFTLTLVVPALAVFIYWRLARRQITDHRVKAELELEAARAVNRGKDQFIAGLSHELRTPLTSIYGFAEILTETAHSDADHAVEVATIIANEAAEMSRMVDDLLTASRLETTGIEIEMTATKVASVVESAITPFERAGMKVERNLNGAVAWTDGARMRHILVNLLSNAARHGGSKVGVSVTTDAGIVDVEVWDNGPGVPEDRLETLFDPFANDGSSPVLAGSVGLGLAVASRVAAKIDGGITYQRFNNKSYFVLRVPSYRDAEPVEATETTADVVRSMAS